jgi:hypothetical protein
VRPGVAQAFVDFSLSHEGWEGFWYKDVKGLVTIGIGELADPLTRLDPSILSQFVNLDGSPANPADAILAWHTVKSDTTINPKLGGAAYGRLTSVRAMKGAITNLTYHMLSANEGLLRMQFPNWDTAPAHAQLAMLSHAWAFGAHVANGWPHLTQAFNLQAYQVCAEQCVPSAQEAAAQNPSFHDRIAQEQAHFRAAARLLSTPGADLDDLTLSP